MSDLPWAHCFVDPADPARPAEILLRQVTRKSFELDSSLRYTGRTGLPALPCAALTVHPADLGPDRRTDLASVPPPLTWFIGPYGVHTPAALLHDRLIGDTAVDGVTEAEADRLFRFMLRELGVRWLRRWMMWSAVAFGTRWRSGGLRRLSVLVWMVLAAVGMTGFVTGLLHRDWFTVAWAGLAPFAAALLWGKQYGAGVFAAATAVWVLPPTLFGAVGFWVYAALERLVSVFTPSSTGGDEPIRYRHF